MLQRVGISLQDDLLDRFDAIIERRGWANRSEAVRDLIRELIIAEDWEADKAEGMGVVVIVYDHHSHELAQKLTELQHKSYATVISAMHVHMDHHNCLEVIIVKGKPVQVAALADSLKALRGVKSGTLSPASTGKRLT